MLNRSRNRRVDGVKSSSYSDEQQQHQPQQQIQSNNNNNIQQPQQQQIQSNNININKVLNKNISPPIGSPTLSTTPTSVTSSSPLSISPSSLSSTSHSFLSEVPPPISPPLSTSSSSNQINLMATIEFTQPPLSASTPGHQRNVNPISPKESPRSNLMVSPRSMSTPNILAIPPNSGTSLLSHSRPHHQSPNKLTSSPSSKSILLSRTRYNQQEDELDLRKRSNSHNSVISTTTTTTSNLTMNSSTDSSSNDYEEEVEEEEEEDEEEEDEVESGEEGENGEGEDEDISSEYDDEEYTDSDSYSSPLQKSQPNLPTPSKSKISFNLPLGSITNDSSNSSPTTSSPSRKYKHISTVTSPRRASFGQQTLPTWNKDSVAKPSPTSTPSSARTEETVQISEYDEERPRLPVPLLFKNDQPPLVVHPIKQSIKMDGVYQFKTTKQPLSRVSSAPSIHNLQQNRSNQPKLPTLLLPRQQQQNNNNNEKISPKQNDESRQDFISKLINLANDPRNESILREFVNKASTTPTNTSSSSSSTTPTTSTHRKKSLSHDSAANAQSIIAEVQQQQQQQQQHFLQHPMQIPGLSADYPPPATGYKSSKHPLMSRKSTSNIESLKYLKEETSTSPLRSPLSSPSPSPREKLVEKELENIEKKKSRPSANRKRSDPALTSPTGNLVSPSITPRVKNSTRQSPSAESISPLTSPASVSSTSSSLSSSSSNLPPPPISTTTTNNPAVQSLSPRKVNSLNLDSLNLNTNQQQSPPSQQQQQQSNSNPSSTSSVRVPISRKYSTNSIVFNRNSVPTTPTSQSTTSCLISPRKHYFQQHSNHDSLPLSATLRLDLPPPVQTNLQQTPPPPPPPILTNNNNTAIHVHDLIEPSHALPSNTFSSEKILSTSPQTSSSSLSINQQQQQSPTMNDINSCGYRIAGNPSGKVLVITVLNNHDDNHYVGLSGIDIFDGFGNHIVTKDIKAYCPTLPTLLSNTAVSAQRGYGYDPRSIERVTDQVPRTCDDAHQWLAPYSKDNPINITINFDSSITLSLIRFWNYNKSRIYSYRGVKDIEIRLDNVFIFKGSIKKAHGTLHSCDECAEYIVFTNDEMVLQSIEKNDPYFPSFNQMEDISPSNMIELQEMIDNCSSSHQPADDETNPSSPTSSSSMLRNQELMELQDYYSKVSLGKDGRPLTTALRIDPTLVEQIHKQGNFPFGKKLKFQFQSTWGDRFYLGLTSIQVFDQNYQMIATTIKNISASPRDINQQGHTGDYRTLDKLIDGHNITTNDQHMWLTAFSFTKDPVLTIDLGQSHHISCIKVYNYNKSQDDTCRGAKNVIISLDGIKLSNDGFIFRKAPGDISFDYGQTISFESFDEPSNLIDNQLNEIDQFIPQDYQSLTFPSGFIFKMVMLSTCGDKQKVGLNGIELYDSNNNLIKPNNIIEANNYKSNQVYRLLDGVNNTWNDKHIWSTTFHHPVNALNKSVITLSNSICIYFDHPISLSMIKIWNFSKTPSQGVEDFELYLDDLLIFKGKLIPSPSSSSTTSTTGGDNQSIDFSQTIIFNHKMEFKNIQRVYSHSIESKQQVSFINNQQIVIPE